MTRLYNDKQDEAPRLCDHPNCREHGEYRAPKSRTNLGEYYYFCLTHIRAYNAGWNYFDGYSEEDMFNQYSRDAGWDRPTWPADIPLHLEKRLMRMIFNFGGFSHGQDTTGQSTPPAEKSSNKRMEALMTLGLQPDADYAAIKVQYRKLVKKHHPDANRGDKRAEERFKIINQAYLVLKEIHLGTQ